MGIEDAVLTSASDLHKIQSLLINVGYLLGVVPFYFDLEMGKVFIIHSKLDMRRWYAALSLSLLVKLLMLFCLLRDIQLGLVKPNVPRHLIRIIMVSGFSCFSLMDLHTASKRNEMVVTINSADAFNLKFRGNKVSMRKRKKLPSFFSLSFY
jgi:hypothetical protein